MMTLIASGCLNSLATTFAQNSTAHHEGALLQSVGVDLPILARNALNEMQLFIHSYEDVPRSMGDSHYATTADSM